MILLILRCNMNLIVSMLIIRRHYWKSLVMSLGSQHIKMRPDLNLSNGLEIFLTKIKSNQTSTLSEGTQKYIKIYPQ